MTPRYIAAVVVAAAACGGAGSPSGGGTVQLTASGEVLALGGYVFPPVNPDDLAFVDGWERNPVFATHGSLDPRIAAHQREIRLRNTSAGLAYSLRLAGQGAMEPLHDRLGEIRVPTLVIAGALDPVRQRAEEVAAGIPGARLAIVKGAGHTPHLERPAAFRSLVNDFLQEDAAT